MTGLVSIFQPAGVPSPIAHVRRKDLPPMLPGAVTVSVIIPCFNYARFLHFSVLSALEQSGVNVEVIIVDDASTDDSLAQAQALARTYSRVRVLNHVENTGPVGTFNDGLAVATGEFLVRLDADDALTPGSLARAVHLAQEFPQVGLVYGHPIHFDGDFPRPRIRRNVRSWTVWAGESWLDYRCVLGVNCITSPEVLMRTSVVRQVGGQRELAHTHDMEMWLRMARASDVGRIDGADQAWHREHSASLSARKVDLLTDLAERAAAFQMLFTDGEGHKATASRRLETSLRAVANEAVARACQAFVRGRGESAEVREYLEFAQAIAGDVVQLPHGPTLQKSMELGANGSRYSPVLLCRAAAYRLGNEYRRFRWKATGL